MWGVQFHPESIATEHGRAIAENFYALAERHRAVDRRRSPTPRAPRRRRRRSRQASRSAAARPRGRRRSAEAAGCASWCGRWQGRRRPSTLYERLFGDAEHSFWLDSADAPTWLAQCSYPRHQRRPRALHALLRRRRAARSRSTAATARRARARLDLRPARPRAGAATRSSRPRRSSRGLIGGYVGYLGYECKADCGSPNVHSSDLPDAAMMLANRVVAVDHAERPHPRVRARRRRGRRGGRALARRRPRTLVAAAIAEPPAGARRWRRRDRARRRTSASAAAAAASSTSPTSPARQAELAAGESYEVCLTDQISTDASPDPFALYRPLRRAQPGPVRRLPALRRARDRQLLAGALPLGRPRRAGSQARPIKGTISAPRGPGRGRGPARRAGRGREDPRRAPDDRRPAAQRPRPRLRGRQRPRPRPDGGRALRDRPPGRLDGRPASSKPSRTRGRVRARLLPRRLDDRRPEGAHDGDHRRPRGRGARRLLGRDRLLRASTARSTSASSSARS